MTDAPASVAQSSAPATVGLLALVVAMGMGGCGTVGPPIPPEEIGIAAKVEREKKLAAEQEKAKAAQPQLEQESEQEAQDDLPDDVTQPLVLPR